jgi:hypothetical protein
MISGATVSFGLRVCAAFGVYNASEDGLGEGFVSGVWEDGHGLSLTFQSGLSFFIADFSAA